MAKMMKPKATKMPKAPKGAAMKAVKPLGKMAGAKMTPPGMSLGKGIAAAKMPSKKKKGY